MHVEDVATGKQWTDNVDTIAQGTPIRVKILGLREDMGEMRAIATINEDFLGYPNPILYQFEPSQLTSGLAPVLSTLRNRKLSSLNVNAMITILPPQVEAGAWAVSYNG